MADNNQISPDRLKNDQNEEECKNDNASSPNRSVRRRLFFEPGEPNEEDLIDELQSTNQDEERRRALEKWNFDFENEIPLRGDWEWEKVVNREPVPNSKEVLVTTKEKLRENRNV